jgi:hypothetical protein
MKKNIITAFALVCFAFLTTTLFAQIFVPGYQKSDGTYVQPHHKSTPNSTVTDNWSFKGNTNPYTGKEGHNYNKHSPSSPFYDGSQKKSKGLFE